VLIVEDDAALRAALADALTESERGFVVVAAVSDLASARRALGTHGDLDVVVIDLGLPDGRGESLIAELAARHPNVASVVLTVHADARTVVAALRAGARGYLLKTTPTDRIAALLDEAIAGGAPMTPAIARLVVDALRSPIAAQSEGDEDARSRVEALSIREREVLELLARGHTYAAIGTALGVAIGTVQAHVRSIYAKLEVASKAEAAAIATRVGLGR
jgi:DNA-binding NarL/FixJ family response regulator